MTDYPQPIYSPGPTIEPRRPRRSGRQKIVALVALAATGALAFALTGGKSEEATARAATRSLRLRQIATRDR
jgi:hypothetical protein